MRVALYARVSTKAQAAAGYSLDQQIEALREHATREGHEVVGEYPDPGYSGTALERPGMDALRDAVEAGGVDVVFAQDADRITRDPVHRGWLDDEFAKHATSLVALDDWGDDSHEGQLLKYIKGWQSKGEAMKTAERSKRNKRKKARGGMVVGGHTRAYGFDWVKNEDDKTIGYEINEDEIRVVHRVFEDVASGVGIRTIKERLDSEHVPTPKGGPVWNRQFLRDMLLSDLHKPHTVEELEAEGIHSAIISGLTERLYGLYRYSDIPVPIPNASIPLEIVLRARERLENNVPTSKNAGRVWELSGGILLCSECGRRMQSHTVKKSHFYYRCQSTMSGKADRCTMRKHVNAGRIETEVWDTVRGLMDQTQYILGKMEEHFEQKRKEVSRAGADVGSLVKRLEENEKRQRKNHLAYEEGVLLLPRLEARLVELEDEREAIENELKRSRDMQGELQNLDETEAEIRERLEAGYGNLDETDSTKRLQVYEDMRLRVEVGSDAVPRVSGIFPMSFEGEPVDVWMGPDGYGEFVQDPVGIATVSPEPDAPS